MNDLKKKLKIQTNQIDQLKEEIRNKDAAQVKVDLEHQKEKEALLEENQRLSKSLQELGSFLN